ncbi:tRNA (guanosine(37)-N1)-methyltransferase TrmD [Entomospira culicis]|uniref:tRNA (guanine-N(1)-)-methyltransferase n=1 Tax=Entomospira culicis TaxID=2719989 RepID=A0A968GIE7_9SPIO|nr:tRNA (guanosine(37)-N1)-methyltransferase TrmD [Entomospira culicis]NIZ19010.1 tRNA (guanosine(37)-N1)-methyltransferase TrmD [Entomospira culicis]NIZ69225.1 tRNA (guanosine(37)-N1)-methyltransferase TrmD [Entomospira culicis]WDI37810.1 tRNA (guanosine(37)-N1)-methyltransferase TrmD [Entomospira culicis]WDI39438.1 tRNA (guanosine(37)-N1)-methyltransferase TrmD [Entomospira culicis]
MKFSILSLFPEFIDAYFKNSIAHIAVHRKQLIDIENLNIRDFTEDKHKKVDDIPYGGGAGMVMTPQPLASALRYCITPSSYVIYATPSGKVFTHQKAKELAQKEHIIFIAGRYEGIDQRIIDCFVDEELSIGDYVLSNGELSSLVMLDAIMRQVPGVIKSESLTEESFEDNLLEYPLYTRPEIFEGLPVPSVLLSGHHVEIKKWKFAKKIEKTLANRPDLMHNSNHNQDDIPRDDDS